MREDINNWNCVLISVDKFQRNDQLRQLVKWCSKNFGQSLVQTHTIGHQLRFGTWTYRWYSDNKSTTIYQFYFFNLKDFVQFSLRWL